MNHNTPIRVRRTIALGLLVAAAITPSAVAAPTEQQFSPPPGATAEPVAPSVGQFSPPPGATGESVAPSSGQTSLYPRVTFDPTAVPPVKVDSVPSSSVLEVPGGLDWADAGIGAGIALGSILLLGGALLVRRSGQGHRLATH